MIGESARRWNTVRDTAAGVLLGGAPFLPWNLYFGVGVPDSDRRLFTVLAAATLLSVLSLIVAHIGPWRVGGTRFNPVLCGRLRLLLNIPYLVLVLGFVAFDAVQTVRYGGSSHVPGGVGPGAWLGAAGAVLAAQPLVTTAASDDVRSGRRPWGVRVLGYASILAAALSVLFNLYWRITYALPNSAAAHDLDTQHIAIIATAVVYGVVAWFTVFVASRWVVQGHKNSQLALVALGVSTLIAGVLVWALPLGRRIDGFHGIAQNTSTAGVGFEGYLVWAAAAAAVAVPALRECLTVRAAESGAWLMSARKVLLLIAVWGVGSALMRTTDLVAAVALGLGYSPYDSAAMAAFDVVTAVLALWLRINLANRSLPPSAVWSLCAVLFGFTIARVVVGIGLAPRLPNSQRSAALANPVYGNGLAQQITSTFDVVLCGLALFGLVVAIVATRFPVRSATAAASHPPAAAAPAAPPPRIFRADDVTEKLPAGTPRIYRAEQDSEQPQA